MPTACLVGERGRRAPGHATGDRKDDPFGWPQSDKTDGRTGDFELTPATDMQPDRMSDGHRLRDLDVQPAEDLGGVGPVGGAIGRQRAGPASVSSHGSHRGPRRRGGRPLDRSSAGAAALATEPWADRSDRSVTTSVRFSAGPVPVVPERVETAARGGRESGAGAPRAVVTCSNGPGRGGNVPS
jgi:hypothetical protein